jgi:hypothetical protein
LTITHIIQKDVSPYTGYGSQSFRLNGGSGMQKCSWYFTMSATDSTLYQIMYTAQPFTLTTLVFSSPTMNEIETSPSPTLTIPVVQYNANFNNSQWNGLALVDSDGNLVPKSWTVPQLAGMLLFVADCLYTIDCGANACNTTTGQCVCPPGYTGVYCDEVVVTTTQGATTGSTSASDTSGDQYMSSGVNLVFGTMVTVISLFISL